MTSLPPKDTTSKYHYSGDHGFTIGTLVVVGGQESAVYNSLLCSGLLCQSSSSTIGQAAPDLGIL